MNEDGETILVRDFFEEERVCTYPVAELSRHFTLFRGSVACSLTTVPLVQSGSTREADDTLSGRWKIPIS
jgi:hypothetical protein